MAQVIIGIGGAHSDVGKTHVAAEVIRALVSSGVGVGALKCEPDPLYASIIDDPSVIGEEGKDTSLMKEAGAGEVLWVRAPREEMHEALAIAMDRLSAHDCVVVEGNTAVIELAGDKNSAIEVSGPCIVLFITGVHTVGRPEKESARRVLDMSHVLIHGGSVPPGAPEGLAEFSREETGAYTAHLVSLVKGALRNAR